MDVFYNAVDFDQYSNTVFKSTRGLLTKDLYVNGTHYIPVSPEVKQVDVTKAMGFYGRCMVYALPNGTYVVVCGFRYNSDRPQSLETILLGYMNANSCSARTAARAVFRALVSDDEFFYYAASLEAIKEFVKTRFCCSEILERQQRLDKVFDLFRQHIPV